MKVSIITVNLNNAVGLRKTMQSVFEQTYVDFEYIIVDGASTDGSIEVISEFNTGVLACFQYVSERDNGIYQAMNKGIRMSHGNYLLFLNSGDFLVDKDVLMHVFSNNYIADILCAECNVSEDGKIIHTTKPPVNVTFGTLYRDGLAHQSTFIRRTLFYDLGFYREDFKYNSDIDFWYRSIIINGATTERIYTIISDYNLDGISSKENNTFEYEEEIRIILTQANFNKFTPDYECYRKEIEGLEIFCWLKSKKYLYRIIERGFGFLKYLKSRS